jgi:hypothetical protein
MDVLQAEYDETTEQITWLQEQLQITKDKRTALKAERDLILAEVTADPVA